MYSAESLWSWNLSHAVWPLKPHVVFSGSYFGQDFLRMNSPPFILPWGAIIGGEYKTEDARPCPGPKEPFLVLFINTRLVCLQRNSHHCQSVLGCGLAYRDLYGVQTNLFAVRTLKVNLRVKYV